MSLSGQTMELIVSLPVENLGVSAGLWMANNVIPFKKHTETPARPKKKKFGRTVNQFPFSLFAGRVEIHFSVRWVKSTEGCNPILERDWVAIQILFAPMNKERNKRL